MLCDGVRGNVEMGATQREATEGVHYHHHGSTFDYFMNVMMMMMQNNVTTISTPYFLLPSERERTLPLTQRKDAPGSPFKTTTQIILNVVKIIFQVEAMLLVLKARAVFCWWVGVLNKEISNKVACPWYIGFGWGTTGNGEKPKGCSLTPKDMCVDPKVTTLFIPSPLLLSSLL